MFFYLSNSHTLPFSFHFLFNDTATTEIYTYGHTLALHAALRILASPHTPGIEPVPFGEIHQYIGRPRNDRAVHAEIRRREGRHVRMPLHVVDQRLSTLFPCAVAVLNS